MAVKIPIIAIVGRPNVGKSTLFNRALGERRAIVEDMPGVTRDRNYAMVESFEVPFLLVDTGGIETDPEDPLGKQVVEQALLAAEEADVIISLFDGSAGCQQGDEDVVAILRRYNKPVYYVVNKCDGDEQALRTADFYQLGIDTIYDCSALHGRRVQLLFRQILEELPNYASLLASAKSRREREEAGADMARSIAAEDSEAELEVTDDGDEGDFEGYGEEESDTPPSFAPVYLPGDDEELSAEDYDREHRHLEIADSVPRETPDEIEHWRDDPQALEDEADAENKIDVIRVAIVGRPNVGKSTLLNTLTGERRAITSPIAGTTRDTLDLEMRRDGQDFLLVDTAGLRKTGKLIDAVERYSALRSMRAMAAADVAVVVLDATDTPTDQDAKIVGLAHEQGLGIVIAVNKWDLVEKSSHKTVHAFTEKLREAFKFAPYAPIVFVSAQSGRRCPRILETAREIAYERAKRVSTPRLNNVLKRAIRKFSPPPYRGRDIKLYYGVQVDMSPPRFALFFNYPRVLHFSFLRFLKNSLRQEFGFMGTDIKLLPRKK